MKKYLFSGLVGLILLVLAACGGDDKAAAPAAVATTAPAAPTEAASTGGTTSGTTGGQKTGGQTTGSQTTGGQTTPSESMQDIAAKLAGGPGAIYIGDISQLAGPAPGAGLGDADENVPLAALQRQEWIYDSEYYRSLLEKAKLDNPTELVTTNFSITIQHACINRTLLPCEVIDAYWVPNLWERTNGQIELVVSSFPELGLAGPDTLSLVEEGTLTMANIYTGYVAGELPAIEVNSLWGIYEDLETMYMSLTDMHPELEAMVLAETGGVVLNHNWFAGNDQFFFSRKKLETLEDFKGMKTRSHAAALSDWIEGMGADAQFVAFSEVYTALERGILDAGVTGANPGFGQRWYEVSEFLVGPLKSFLSTNNVINGTVWDKIPEDLQQIFLEEGAKSELEALRLASIQNETGTLKNIDAGMELVEFSDELATHSFSIAVVEHVIPGWLRRLGGTDNAAVALFNDKVGPYVGLAIESDGTVVTSEIVKGPHAGESSAMAMTPTVSAELQSYADAHAGGPGSIYVGDISQLVGTALPEDLGDFDGNVPLYALESHMYIYESDYYQGLIEKANLTNPTELVSEGLDITIQDACINRTLSFCKMTNEYFYPNVLARTNGQLKLVSSSYPELGISGTDNLGLIADGTLGMAIVAGAYVAGEVPALDISFLEGLYPDRETMFNALSALVPDLKQLHEDATGGDAIVILINWSPGDDRYFFSQKPLRTVEDFKGMKVRAFGTTISDWIIGMGASAQFVAFAEVYTALERGILDAGVTGASPAYGQRWYEVTKYMNGPLVNFPIVPTMINRAVWDGIPTDLQQIMIEESAKTELEMLRVSSIHNEIILEKSIKAGLEFVEFSPEVRERSNDALFERVVPNWVKRVGGGDQPVIELFNEHIGERIGMHVKPDGTVVKAPITK